MIDKNQVELSVVGKISDIGEQDWDACASNGYDGRQSEDPFVSYRFLKGLEDSKSVGAGTGCVPQYIIAKCDKKIIGVMPSFAKGHSQGEYIFSTIGHMLMRIQEENIIPNYKYLCHLHQ